MFKPLAETLKNNGPTLVNHFISRSTAAAAVSFRAQAGASGSPEGRNFNAVCRYAAGYRSGLTCESYLNPQDLSRTL